MEELPFEELTYSLWVDDSFVPRKMSSDMGGIGSLEVRPFGVGKPVEIEAPPADQVGRVGRRDGGGWHSSGLTAQVAVGLSPSRDHEGIGVL
jgi:hypothetical protein